ERSALWAGRSERCSMQDSTGNGGMGLPGDAAPAAERHSMEEFGRNGLVCQVRKSIDRQRNTLFSQGALLRGIRNILIINKLWSKPRAVSAWLIVDAGAGTLGEMEGRLAMTDRTGSRRVPGAAWDS